LDLDGDILVGFVGIHMLVLLVRIEVVVADAVVDAVVVGKRIDLMDFVE
jgi:hypothetical protein